MVSLVDAVLTLMEEVEQAPRPHQIPQLLVTKLEDQLHQMDGADENSWKEVMNLILCLATMEGKRMLDLKSRIVPLFHQVTAWVTDHFSSFSFLWSILIREKVIKQPRIFGYFESEFMDLLCDFVEATMDDTRLLNENSRELVLRAFQVTILSFSSSEILSYFAFVES